MVISSPFLDELGPSSIRAITAKIRDRAAEGIQVTSFAGGLPSPEFFPVEELKEITSRCFDEEGGNLIQYAASDGYDPFRKYLVEFMAKYFSVTGIDYKNILITSGSQQGLAYLTKGLVGEGSVIIVENPSYPGALDTFSAYGAAVVGVDMDDDGMRMDLLEEALRANEGKVAFIYTIADFQNPSGRTMSLERRKIIVELAEKYNTFIVEDAPYSMICFEGGIMPAIKSMDPYGRVIYSGSTSKTIAPGLRIGWLIADHESINKLVYLKMRDDLQVNNISQRQVLHYLKDYDFDAHLRTVIDVYRSRRDAMIGAIEKSFPAGTKITVPKGGIFLWLELPEEYDTNAIFDFVFSKNIAYVPGCYFSPTRGGKNTMRLNFATTGEAEIERAITLLGEMICASI